MLKMQTADFTMEIGRFSSGSPGRTRTSDRVVNSHLLYQLSYRGTIYLFSPLFSYLHQHGKVAVGKP